MRLDTIDREEPKDEIMAHSPENLKVKNQRRLDFNDFEDRNLKYQIRSIHETENEGFQKGLGLNFQSGSGNSHGFTRVRMGEGEVDENSGVNKAKTYDNGHG